MDRRNFIKTSAIATISTIGFPAILSAENKYPTIKVLGTHVTLQEIIRKKAMEDLKINIEFYPGGNAEVLTKAIADPSSFDLYEQWSNSTRLLWNFQKTLTFEHSFRKHLNTFLNKLENQFYLS